MAFRIQDSVVRGEIDNRVKGVVCGRIWLCDREEPLALELQGNAHPDLAGSLLTFENRLPASAPHNLEGLSPVQKGTIGDLTASRKVRVFDIPFEEAYAMIHRGEKPPEHMANCLYLEWFSEANGRVVIESADYQLSISPPEWRLTPEENEQRAEEAASGFSGFMQKLGEAIEQARFEAPEDRPMDEFEWEQALRESDALTDKAKEIFEKHANDPNIEDILAREMGWDDAGPGLEDVADVEEEEMNRLCSEGEEDPPEPDPLTEGVDWVRDEDGHPAHPLLVRIRHAWVPLWHWCDERHLLDDNGSRELHEMFFKFQSCGAKCAGALGGLAYAGDIREPGFIVAGLKRALALLHESLQAAGGVKASGVLPAEQLEPFRRELFAVRQEILSLMERFRSEAG
jgi:hypothetical protein